LQAPLFLFGMQIRVFCLKPQPIDPREKIWSHIDAIFGSGISEGLPAEVEFEYSRRTGRIKNFSIEGQLAGTLRTDGGIALTIPGAQYFSDHTVNFRENCVIPRKEVAQFISEGRSLFCRHVDWCGSNVQAGSDVAVVDKGNVIAVGVAILPSRLMKQFNRGVAVKIREGIKGRTE